MQTSQRHHQLFVFAVFFIFSICLLITGCQKSNIYSIHLRSGLSDGGKIDMKIDIYLKEKTGEQEVESKLTQVRHAISLIFTRINCSDLENNGKTRAENALSKVLRQIIKTPIQKVHISDYQLTAAS